MAISLGWLTYAQNEISLQQFNFNIGKNLTSFHYKNDSGVRDTNMSYKSGNQFEISFGIALDSRHLIRPEIIFNEAGAKSSFQSIDVTWKMNYIGAGTSYLFKVIDKPTFSVSPGIRISFDYLLSGEQTIGMERYNVKKNDAFKVWDITAGANLNACYKVTEKLYLNMEYRFNSGLNQIEKKDVGEKTRNIAHSTLIGLSFNL